MERLDTLIGQVLLGGSGRWPGLQFRCGGGRQAQPWLGSLTC